jgi:hypothetical protein
MKRLMVVALFGFVLVIGDFVIAPQAIAQASGCDDRTREISKGAPSGCALPLWRQGPTTLKVCLAYGVARETRLTSTTIPGHRVGSPVEKAMIATHRVLEGALIHS